MLDNILCRCEKCSGLVCTEVAQDRRHLSTTFQSSLLVVDYRLGSILHSHYSRKCHKYLSDIFLVPTQKLSKSYKVDIALAYVYTMVDSILCCFRKYAGLVCTGTAQNRCHFPLESNLRSSLLTSVSVRFSVHTTQESVRKNLSDM